MLISQHPLGRSILMQASRLRRQRQLSVAALALVLAALVLVLTLTPLFRNQWVSPLNLPLEPLQVVDSLTSALVLEVGAISSTRDNPTNQLLLCLVMFLSQLTQCKVEAYSTLLPRQRLVASDSLKVVQEHNHLVARQRLHLEEEDLVHLANPVLEDSHLEALAVVLEEVQPVQNQCLKACSNQESEIIHVSDNH